MSKLKELVEWFGEGICEGDGKLIMDKARSLLAEEQKPVEERGLWEEVNRIRLNGLEMQVNDHYLWADELGNALSRHRPVKEEPLEKWCSVKKGWWQPYNLVAKVLGDPINCGGQKWFPLQWDGMDDPDYFKEIGLEFFTTREAARKYLESLPDKGEGK